MRTESKTAVKNSIGRMMLVALSVFLQMLWLFILAQWLDEYSAAISIVATALALLLVCVIYSKDINSAMKTPWIIAILLFPIMGMCLYFLVGHSDVTKGMRKRFDKICSPLNDRLIQDENLLSELENKDIGIANQIKYIVNYGKYPVYQNTDVEFYDDALKGIEAQMEELKKAQKFIFMEYHAIEDAESFDSIKKILAQKARQGVEVRIFYDDIGSIGFIDHDFIQRMEALGIKCRVFNPLIPFLSVFMNNRDHRKITVIDGKVGFTGGYNLANEYFNITHPYGHWKDTGIKLTGDAVKSLTVMFLGMWNSIKETDESYDSFFPDVEYNAEQCGYIQPYADSPLDTERVGESVYMNIIKNAKRYVYFMTPYLIISDEISRELELAAKRGIDVRIITPGIPDKKVIFEVTRSYYARLSKAGIRIYEYTPGFCHAKQCVCDDEIATVGTINLDYRSLYFHFENSVLLYNCSAVDDMKADFDNTFSKSTEVTEKYRSGRSAVLRLGQCALRLVSPLL